MVHLLIQPEEYSKVALTDYFLISNLQYFSLEVPFSLLILLVMLRENKQSNKKTLTGTPIFLIIHIFEVRRRSYDELVCPSEYLKPLIATQGFLWERS